MLMEAEKAFEKTTASFDDENQHNIKRREVVQSR